MRNIFICRIFHAIFPLQNTLFGRILRYIMRNIFICRIFHAIFTLQNTLFTRFSRRVMRNIFICRIFHAFFLIPCLGECRVDGEQHFVEQRREEAPFFAVDGEESEVFDDGAQRLFVRPEGEGERLIVEFEHALFFRTKSL